MKRIVLALTFASAILGAAVLVGTPNPDQQKLNAPLMFGGSPPPICPWDTTKCTPPPPPSPAGVKIVAQVKK